MPRRQGFKEERGLRGQKGLKRAFWSGNPKVIGGLDVSLWERVMGAKVGMQWEQQRASGEKYGQPIQG